MAGQWFPKLGVWEGAEGWDAHVFHANSEFYADFGDYEVSLTLPEGWVVGATGRLVEETPTVEGQVAHTFRAEDVIDFAWSASPNFAVDELAMGDVELRVLYYPSMEGTKERVVEATTGAFPLYEEWYGPYGGGYYDHLTVVVVPPSAGGAGGMEYPQLFTVGALGGAYLPECVRLTEVETTHELAHQWFQSVVATNEAEEPWLDEGFTDYSTVRAMEALYRGGVLSCGGWSFSYLAMRRMEYLSTSRTPMAGYAWELPHYSTATYSKPALALTTLERVVGEEAMLAFLGSYVDAYAFRHPTATEVREVMAETLGEGTATRFFEDFVHGDGVLDAQVAELEGDGARVVREGDACAPSEAVVTYENDHRVDAPWPCGEPELEFHGTTPIARAQADPERRIPIDVNLANNGLLDAPDTSAWLGVVARTLDLVQGLFLLGGGLW
jgi:hypothetical protein